MKTCPSELQKAIRKLLQENVLLKELELICVDAFKPEEALNEIYRDCVCVRVEAPEPMAYVQTSKGCFPEILRLGLRVCQPNVKHVEAKHAPAQLAYAITQALSGKALKGEDWSGLIVAPQTHGRAARWKRSSGKTKYGEELFLEFEAHACELG